jgi:hypothetical protein
MDLGTLHARAGGIDLPRPLRAARPFLALSLLLAGVTAAGLIPAVEGLMLGALCAGAGAIRAGMDQHDLSKLRRLADEQLLHGAEAGSSPLLGWRASEVISARNRSILSRSLRGVVRDLGRTLPGASPLNRVGARPHAGLIERLSFRVGDLERPCSPRGILRVQQLLTDGWGPLYERSRAAELPGALERCLVELDDTPVSTRGLRLTAIGRPDGVRRPVADARARSPRNGAGR